MNVYWDCRIVEWRNQISVYLIKAYTLLLLLWVQIKQLHCNFNIDVYVRVMDCLLVIIVRRVSGNCNSVNWYYGWGKSESILGWWNCYMEGRWLCAYLINGYISFSSECRFIPCTEMLTLLFTLWIINGDKYYKFEWEL